MNRPILLDLSRYMNRLICWWWAGQIGRRRGAQGMGGANGEGGDRAGGAEGGHGKANGGRQGELSSGDQQWHGSQRRHLRG